MESYYLIVSRISAARSLNDCINKKMKIYFLNFLMKAIKNGPTSPLPVISGQS